MGRMGRGGSGGVEGFRITGLRPARSHIVPHPRLTSTEQARLQLTYTTLILRQSRSLRVSALHCCAIGGHPGVAEILIEAGADTNLRDGVRLYTVE